jgi:hypothetical protein
VVFSLWPGFQHIKSDESSILFAYFPAAGWSIGTSPNMLVNWYARKNSNKVTFPIGLNVSKVVKIGPLPVKVAVQGQYMPVHPDLFGQQWNLQFSVTPVIPKLVKGNILED